MHCPKCSSYMFYSVHYLSLADIAKVLTSFSHQCLVPAWHVFFSSCDVSNTENIFVYLLSNNIIVQRWPAALCCTQSLKCPLMKSGDIHNLMVCSSGFCSVFFTMLLLIVVSELIRGIFRELRFFQQLENVFFRLIYLNL